MTVLDAYAVIAFLRDEPAAGQVRSILDRGDGELTAVGLAEVTDHMVRLAGGSEEEVALDLAQLGLLEAIPVDALVGGSAGRLRARYYHRTRCPVSLADCVAAETARRQDRPLATADPDLLDVCDRERIPFHVLPASDGTLWTAGSA